MSACDCINTLPNKVAEHLKAKGAVTGPVKKCAFDNEALLLGDELTQQAIGLPVTVTYVHTSKAGNVTIKKAKSRVFPTYCPFCGIKVKS